MSNLHAIYLFEAFTLSRFYPLLRIYGKNCRFFSYFSKIFKSASLIFLVWQCSHSPETLRPQLSKGIRGGCGGCALREAQLTHVPLAGCPGIVPMIDVKMSPSGITLLCFLKTGSIFDHFWFINIIVYDRILIIFTNAFRHLNENYGVWTLSVT